MSDLGDKIDEILWENKPFLTVDICLNLRKQIIDAFKAHIEEFKVPNNPNELGVRDYNSGLYYGWKRGIEAFRKALMESLKTSD